MASELSTLFRIMAFSHRKKTPAFEGVSVEDVVQDCCINFWKHTLRSSVLRRLVESGDCDELRMYLGGLISKSTRQRMIRFIRQEIHQRGYWWAHAAVQQQDQVQYGDNKSWWEQMLDIASAAEALAINQAQQRSLCPARMTAALDRAGGASALEVEVVEAAAEFFEDQGHMQTAATLRQALATPQVPAKSKRTEQRRRQQSKQVLRETLSM